MAIQNRIAGFMLIAAIASTAAQFALAGKPAEHEYIGISSVSEVEPGLYDVASDAHTYRVLAPAASNLASLANFDALSEDWTCKIARIPGVSPVFTATDCSSAR